MTRGYKFILMVLIALVSPSGWAATYYVDPTSGSDANAGTVCASPIAGYSKAGFLAALVAGDYVLQKAGTSYTGQLSPSVSGSSGSPITFGVYVSCAAPAQVTDGSSRAVINANNASSGAVLVTSRSYLSLIGIDVEGSTDTSGVVCQMKVQQSDHIVVSYSTARAGNGPGKCGYMLNRGNTETYSYLIASGMTANGLLLYGATGQAATDITITYSDFSNNNTAASSANAGIKWGPDDATATLTRLILTHNTCHDNGFATGNGIRSSGALISATISYNHCTGNKYGLYLESTSDTEGTGDNYTGTVVSYNTFNLNQDVGIQNNRADYVTYEYNTTNYNGADTATDFGRGLEIVGTTANHARFVTVRYNTALGNYNYIANGSEGVGIAFDNYTDDSVMYGNLTELNEGNGIQTFICLRCVIAGNIARNNGVNFRGGAAANNIKAELHVGSSSTNVYVANNTIISDCTRQARYGIAESNASDSTGVIVRNNYIQGACVGGVSVRSTTTHNYNGFWQNTATNLNAADDTALSAGTGDVTADSTISATYRPLAGSPLRRAGASLGVCIDFRGRACYPDRPDIGAYQSSSGDPAATRSARN